MLPVEREPVAVMRAIAGDEGALDGRDEVAGPVDLALDERQVRLVVARIGDHAQRVERGLARLPVARVAAELPHLVAKGAHLGERSGADGVGVGEGERIGDGAPHVRGHDRLLRQLDEAGHEGARQREFDGVRVDGAHGGEEVPDAGGVEGARRDGAARR